MRKFLYLPSGYKKRSRTIIEGRARSGEISPKGLVSHTEYWDDSVKVKAVPGTVRVVVEPDGRLRNMTMAEMLERGSFFLGKGPSGFK
jgi:hypothetical protein